VVLGFSLLIIGGILSVFFFDAYVSSHAPPVLRLLPQLEQVRPQGDGFLLPVMVRNEGESVARNVWVGVTVGDEFSVEISVDQLAGGETESFDLQVPIDPREARVRGMFSYEAPESPGG
jgi:uncharacterized protein (TIGR02588 family)